MNKPDLKNLSLDQLTDFTAGLGLPAFRARQIFSWLYRPGIRNFVQMTDIAKELRLRLEERAEFSSFEPAVLERSEDGTIKFGFLLNDGNLVETVLISEEDRHTLCVSSQVGCAMDCAFCLTGSMGFKRNLSPAEMVNQVCAVQEYLHTEGRGVLNNLVFMGMGEPLANLDNLLIALAILTEQRGLDFSDRRITVSTCGLVPKMRELGLNTTVNLAVSLHSVDNEVRSRLMPINRTYGVEVLLAACREFPMPKRKRIMFEYILLAGINDSAADAELLARRLQGIRCKINLLPYNETPALAFKRSSVEQIEKFQQILWRAGYTVLIRNSRGADISAACGQLAGREKTDQP
ncbi:MAG: 23S rRNA (adenine(2503)-C(2))-methyltransferase [Deltaproteobacteria bacterium RIFOXYD12_FULL_57_12]|nr:MAG: 23S rRNA (adenine(2503)-C(2))-methyltransferase [Deltaproteobacteria bacterium RIFOXYD12_FULL_57_12]